MVASSTSNSQLIPPEQEPFANGKEKTEANEDLRNPLASFWESCVREEIGHGSYLNKDIKNE